MGKILAVLFVPVIIVIIFALATSVYQLNNYKSLLISNYSNELNSFLKDTEETMNSIIHSSSFIAGNQEIRSALTAREKPSPSNATDIISLLLRAESFTGITDSVTVYNRNAGFVISGKGLYDADIYFGSVYSYESYPESYWASFHSSSGSTKILAPTTVKTDSSENKTIVPMVFNSPGSVYSGNFIIINVDINKIFEKFEVYRLTTHSKVYMRDNSTSKILSSASPFGSDAEMDLTHSQTLLSSLQSNTEKVSLGGKDYLMIASTERLSVYGYTYFVLVPYSDINASVSGILLISGLFVLILFVFMIIFVIVGAKTLYTPWKNLASAAKNTATAAGADNSEANIADYISDTLLNLSQMNEKLDRSLKVALPLSQEKYLIDILNDNTDTDSSNERLEQLSFKHEYFCSVAVKLTINPDFFIGQESFITMPVMQNKLRRVIRDMFAQKFITYEFSGTNDILYLLLNVDNDSYLDEITRIMDEFIGILQPDKDNLDAQFGIGGIYKGFDGLKLTHREAMFALSKKLCSRIIQFNIDGSSKYVFPVNSENILANYLSAGFADKAKSFLENIFEMISSETSAHRLQIYKDIALALNRTARQKSITIADSALDCIIATPISENTLSDSEIRAHLLGYSEAVCEHIQNNSKKVDIRAVIEYINDHFSEDIYLDNLAERFNTSAKYLSKRIKQYLDISFKDYITQLKIDKAKELLTGSDTPISELYIAVGFQNRSAFSRAFKLKTGLSPSDYKKTYSAQ